MTECWVGLVFSSPEDDRKGNNVKCTKLQELVFFSFSFFGIGTSDRQTNISGLIPIDLNSLTECWVGLVFSSPEDDRKGNNVKCTKMQELVFFSWENWRMASKKGRPSISPIVPPISQSMKSTSSSCWARNFFISFVTWGITCIVSPR